MIPWNDWYHVMGHTYGTWLPGSAKGFRTRHHREHVEGDYRNPPPKGKYDELYERSKRLMQRDPVYLDVEQRKRALDELIASLQRRNIEIAAASVDRIHKHILARFPDHDPRRWVGIAKKESSHYCKVSGHAPEGGLWGTRCECVPVRDESHRLNVVDYILDHAEKGAATYRPAPLSDLHDFDPSSLLIS
jgi:hypothetical protein